MRIILVTEYINPPYDEGIKKTVFSLFTELQKHFDIQVICRYGFEKENIHIIKTNPLFINKNVRYIIKTFDPDVLIYFPFASATFASYLRLRILSWYAGRARKIFIALQPKTLKIWQKLIVRFIKPKYGLTPSPELKKYWDKINVDNQLLPLLTNLSKYRPVENIEHKNDLRKKYNLPENTFIISHIGHLNEGRNLEALIPLQNAGYQVVIVGSSSTPLDAIGPDSLKEKLLNSGIILYSQYIENIEEIYQLSDLYIFPVVSKTGSIGLPLSILEARACGIPVLSTDFGSVKHFLNSDYGGIYYSQPDNFLTTISSIKNNHNYINSKIQSLNDLFYETIFSVIK